MMESKRREGFLAKVGEITRKYKTPRIKATPAVKFALLALRVYLFVLVGLLAYKFVTLL